MPTVVPTAASSETSSAAGSSSTGAVGANSFSSSTPMVKVSDEVFSPSEKDVAKAKRILEAMAQAQKEGKGAVALDGRLIDIASIKQAENLVRKAEQIAGAA